MHGLMYCLVFVILTLRVGARLGRYCWTYWDDVYSAGYRSMNMYVWREAERSRKERFIIYLLYPWTSYAAKGVHDTPPIARWWNDEPYLPDRRARQERYLLWSAWTWSLRVIGNLLLLLLIGLHFSLRAIGRGLVRLSKRMAFGKNEGNAIPSATVLRSETGSSDD